MTHYSNPQIPEGINVTKEHPLKDFFWMLAGVGMVVILALTILMFSAEYLLRYIPHTTERALADSVLDWDSFRLAEPPSSSDTPPDIQQAQASPSHKASLTTDQQKVELYLQTLANQMLTTAGGDTAEASAAIPVTIHFLDHDMVNAFATLGGHIFMARGLLAKMPNENAMAMVLAHEIAHVQRRDPLIATGRGLVIALAAFTLLGAGDGQMAQQLVGQINLVTSLKLSRDAENQSDALALTYLQQYYGHVEDADFLFTLLQQTKAQPFEWLSSHPDHDERIARIKQFASAHPSRMIAKPKALPSWWDEVMSPSAQDEQADTATDTLP